MGQVTIKPVELFYSYAHEDEWLRNELEQHLSGLKRQGYLTGWHDRLIQPGTSWEEEIDEHLNTADIIALLISPSFLASDYCYGIEMKRAMERYQAKEAHVIPILLRPVYWSDTPWNKLQVLPSSGLPVVSWNNRDNAFVDVVKGIRQIIIGHPPSTHQANAPVNALYAFSSLKAEATPTVSENPPEDPWSKFGLTGEVIGSYVQSQEWGRAESAARQIGNEQQRAQMLSLLVQQLAKARQWERAEAIAHSLAYPYRDDAFIALIKELTAAKLWERAEALTRSLTSRRNRTAMFSNLSRALLKAGHIERAQRLAYETEESYPATSISPRSTYTQSSTQSSQAPSSRYAIPRTGPPLAQPSRANPSRARSSFSVVSSLLAALIILAISAIILLLIKHTLLVAPVVWIIISATAICGGIIFGFLRARWY
jgi:hypothetical protein